MSHIVIAYGNAALPALHVFATGASSRCGCWSDQTANGTGRIYKCKLNR